MVRSLNQAGVTAAYEYSSTACVNSSSLLFFYRFDFPDSFSSSLPPSSSSSSDVK